MYVDNGQLDNLINKAIDRVGFIDTMIVEVRYKYSWENEWTIDNQILRVRDGDKFYWQSDWWEGQEDVEYVGIIPLSSVVTWHYLDSIDVLTSPEPEDRLISAKNAKAAMSAVLESCNDDEFYGYLKTSPKMALIMICMGMKNAVDSVPTHSEMDDRDEINRLETIVDKLTNEIIEHKRHIAELKNVINDCD